MSCKVLGCPKVSVTGPGYCLSHFNRWLRTGAPGSPLTCTHRGCPEPAVTVVRQRYISSPWVGCAEHWKAMASALAIGQRVDDSGVVVHHIPQAVAA